MYLAQNIQNWLGVVIELISPARSSSTGGSAGLMVDGLSAVQQNTHTIIVKIADFCFGFICLFQNA